MDFFFPGKFPQKIKLMEKGGVCVFDENLREISVCFKTRRGISVILVNLRGDECNFPVKILIIYADSKDKNVKLNMVL